MDLSLVHVQDLYDELTKRFDHIILCAKKYNSNHDSQTSRRYKGDYHVCVGLCDDVKGEVLRELKEKEIPLTPDDL